MSIEEHTAPETATYHLLFKEAEEFHKSMNEVEYL